MPQAHFDEEYKPVIRSVSSSALTVPTQATETVPLRRSPSFDFFVRGHGQEPATVPHVAPLLPPPGNTTVSRAARACSVHRAPRIVLTGGPCGGKTSVLKRLRAFLEAKGLQVYVIPEAATLIIGGGRLPLGNHSLGALARFEKSLFKLQMALEDTMNEGAEEMGCHRSVILCDRGLSDNKAYLDDATQASILAELGLTEDDIGKNRYDLVLHLDTTAKGAPEHYNWAGSKHGTNNPARVTPPEEACELDDKVLRAWDNETYRVRFKNHGQSFTCKEDQVIAAVDNFLKDKKTLRRATAHRHCQSACHRPIARGGERCRAGDYANLVNSRPEFLSPHELKADPKAAPCLRRTSPR